MSDMIKNPTEICKYLDVEEYCVIVYQITEDYFYPTPQDCSTCMKCGVGVNDFTILKAQELGFEVRKDLIGKGPGSLLKTIISWFVDKPPGCECENRSKIMDLWGYEGCRQKQNTIRHWLRESARQHNKYVPDLVISALIKAVVYADKILPQEKEPGV